MLKKVLVVIMALVMVMSFAGCSNKTDTDNYGTDQQETDTTTDTDTTTPDTAAAITVGLVTDVGGIDDKSFNQGTWEGIQKFAAETGAEVKYLQSSTDADYVPNLSTFSDEGMDLVVSPGFLFFDALTQVSANYPDEKYLIIDSVLADSPNVASAVFAAEQGSFLVGVAAALKAEEAGKDTVGFVGGIDMELIQNFEAGYKAGVAAVNPDIKVLTEYAGAFDDAQKGQTLAAKMYNDGAYVIYQAAGSSGNGVIKEAKDRAANGEDVWVIGVDKDQYADGIYDGTNSVILTSMMKRVDVAAYDVAKQTIEGNFPGGQTLVFTLENGGVGIPETNPNMTDEMVAKVKEFSDKIVAGEITVPLLPERVQQQ